MARLTAVVVLAATTAGCWLQAGFGPARRAHNDLETAVTAATVADLAPRWTATVGTRPGEAVVDQGRALVPSDDGLTALALGTGAEQWTGCCQGEPAVVDGQVLVAAGGVDRCVMWSVDPATGAADEQGRLGPELPGFLGGCGTGAVLGVGSRAIAPWAVRVGPAPGGSPGPCLRGQNYWLVGAGVAAFDTAAPGTGWERDESQGICVTGSATPPGPDLGAVSYDGTSVLLARGRSLQGYPLDCTAAGCPPAWNLDVGTPTVGPPVVLVGGDIALATSDGRVVVVDGTTHLVAWTATLGSPLDQALAATPSTIFATTTAGTVVALPADGCGAATCGPGWTAALAAPASARPSIGGDVVYVGSAEGTVTALPAAGCGSGTTCDALWTGTTPARVTGAPVITAGTVVVSSVDGTVTAFGLPSG